MTILVLVIITGCSDVDNIRTNIIGVWKTSITEPHPRIYVFHEGKSGVFEQYDWSMNSYSAMCLTKAELEAIFPGDDLFGCRADWILHESGDLVIETRRQVGRGIWGTGEWKAHKMKFRQIKLYKDGTRLDLTFTARNERETWCKISNGTSFERWSDQACM